MKIRLLLTMAIALLLGACNNDEETDGGINSQNPVTFTAAIQPEIETRITVNNGWTGLADSKMAISIDGAVKEYAVSELGEVTSSNPFYWEGKESMVVDAWYPYNNGVKPETIIVSADQSVAANYEKSDYLEVVGATVTAKKSTLNFTHRTAKVLCTLTLSLDDTKDARLILHNLSGVDEGTSVITTNKYRALVVPQTIPAGTEFVEVQTGVTGRYVHTLKEDLEFKKGYVYRADITISTSSIDVVFTESSKWVADVETPDAQTPEANPGSGNNNWSGDNESAGGNSSTANPDNGNGGWNGNNEDAIGNSSEATPGNEDGGWNGDNENVTGTDTDPDAVIP